MADLIKLVTWNEETVTPLDDAIVYETAIGSGGVSNGCTVTLKDSNTLHIAPGHGVICGRKFTVYDGDIAVGLSPSGTLQGRLYLHLDLSNVTEPIALLVETGSTLTPPVQDDNVNIVNGTYDINLYTFNVSPSEISNLTKVFDTISQGDIMKMFSWCIATVPATGWALDSTTNLYENVLTFDAI